MNCHIDLVDKRNNDAFEHHVIVLRGWTFKRALQCRNKIKDRMWTKSDL